MALFDDALRIGFLATFLAVASTGVAGYTVNVSQTEHQVSQRYVSFTLDLFELKNGFRGWNLTDPQFVAVAQLFSPCVLRLGGTAQDNVTYQGFNSRPSVGIPQNTMTTQQWDEINQFATKVGWEIVFGLDALQGWDGEPGASGWAWDSQNARSLIEYTVKKQYPVVGWELGNEPDLNNKNGAIQSGSGVASRFASLVSLLGEMYPKGLGGGTPASPWVIGPDVTKGGIIKGFLSEFLGAITPPTALNAVTWHHYYVAGSNGVVNASDFVNPLFLNTYIAAARQASAIFSNFSARVGTPAPMLWMGETSGAGGATVGAELVKGKFLGVFWFADKLGAAAATGHAVVCKQQYQYQVLAQPPGGVEVTPEFWLSLLWKRLMGRSVLTVIGGHKLDLVRAYAHRSATQVSVVIINLDNESIQVPVNLTGNAGLDAATTHDQYQLTAWPTPSDLQSNGTALNGQQLQLSGDVNSPLPSLTPVTVAGPVTAGGHSVTFAVFQL